MTGLGSDAHRRPRARGMSGECRRAPPRHKIYGAGPFYRQISPTNPGDCHAMSRPEAKWTSTAGSATRFRPEGDAIWGISDRILASANAASSENVSMHRSGPRNDSRRRDAEPAEQHRRPNRRAVLGAMIGSSAAAVMPPALACETRSKNTSRFTSYRNTSYGIGNSVA